MKNSIKFPSLFFVIFVLFAFAIVSCEEIEGENTECNEICADIEEAFGSHGDCMSLCNTCLNPSESTGNTAVCICNYIEVIIEAEGSSWEEFTGGDVKNFGQCVKLVKAEILASED